jgi:L-fuculose-phosphate aldolase
MKTEHQLRRAVLEVSGLLWEQGWVANHDGNVTARAAPGRIVATPTGLSKRKIDADRLLVLDSKGNRVQGRLRPFSERGLHVTVYQQRPDVGAVVHAHPPYATARAASGTALPCFLPESVVSLGREIPLVPFAPPGSEAEQALVPFVEPYDGVLLECHGVLTWGDDPEQAYLRMELIEHLARIAYLAQSTGGVQTLSEDTVQRLLQARARAGLGPEGRNR